MYLESSYRSYVFNSKEEIIDFLKTVDENHAKLEVSVSVEDRGVNGEPRNTDIIYRRTEGLS
jgi:hypothetical protein